MERSRSIAIIEEVVEYSYELLMEKMRTVNNVTVENGKLAIDNEASLQLEFGSILKAIGRLYEFTPKDRFIVLLEKKEEIEGSLKSDNSRMDVYIEYGGIKAALELKFFKKKNGAKPNNCFKVYADLYNLELYNEKGYDLCYFILVTDNEEYMNKVITGKAENFTLKEGGKYEKGVVLEYPKLYSGTFSLKHDYNFIWNKDSSDLYFLKLKLPVDKILSKERFLADKYVQDFISWLGQRLDSESEYCYEMKNCKKDPKCSSLYAAYKNYNWKFRLKEKEGNSFEDSSLCLNELSSQLKESINQGNNKLCQEACLSILKWGGALHSNEQKIKSLGNSLIEYLREAKDKLTTDTVEEADFYKVLSKKNVYMNSGFSKIYSLYIDDYIIYDSRVGAALGLLVRKFAEDRSLSHVPEMLTFAYGNGRSGVNRNPSSDKYKFPLLRSGDRYNNHIENNLKANWLLKETLLRNESQFNKEKDSLRALEAALFMIGYSVPDVCDNNK